MKKNRMMRLASLLLVMCLLTTSVISGTFAKYATASESEDRARVAYWGFNATTFTIDDLFENAYDETVEAATNVIAPGTSGDAKFSFKPQNATAPEVAYKITVKADESTIAEDLVDNTNIQFKLDDDGEWGSFADLKTAINALSTGEIDPNEFDDNWGATSEHTIYWRWLINDVSDAKDAQNVKDTALGNKTSLDEVYIKISILAEQVD